MASALVLTGLSIGGVTYAYDRETLAAAQPSPVSTQQSRTSWRLVAAETFKTDPEVSQAPWVRDPHGPDSPWHVDHLDDDGEFFTVRGGSEFERHLAGADILRKRVQFGDGGWLTAELAARDADKDGQPEGAPTFTAEHGAGVIDEPSHDSGLIIRSTEPLPEQYRIEYRLRGIEFGGKRDGTFEYDGKINGYEPTGCKTNWPWKRTGALDGPADRCNANFDDVRSQNGYYFLSIMDYAKPAPHNNVFIHNHRKVGMDAYNVNGPWARAFSVCNPSTGQKLNYLDSTANGVNEIFFDGSRYRDPSIGYNEFIMPTECGLEDGATPRENIVSAAEIKPEIMPRKTYTFAIERTATSYIVEMSGEFKYIGKTTLRYERDFVEDGTPIWHYNQRTDEYDGQFNTTLTFDGPYGSYTREQWPAGSAYPDNFVIGDPHMNYYEGSAVIDDIRLYVPRHAQAGANR
ncbi:hypothetical protein [Luethyella okanaganae]|uniref:Uncharacterized protein n=1 Tax=Luethyella okanaganae TaxID=69372 RepID=A0ABW1VAH7_9MICO